MIEQLIKDLQAVATPEKAASQARFFKTGKGQYGEGDIFLGITVPEQRIIAKKYLNMSLDSIQKMLASPIHEHRVTGLLILVERFKKSGQQERKRIVDFYLKNINSVNNWDLVDMSAPQILGEYLLHKDKKMLYKLAKSKTLWERRIAIVATYAFIRKGFFDETLKISEFLLGDRHDLIHKAVGWMLREVGKKDKETLERFLKKHRKTMPRTMLRYAIELFSKKEKDFYMNK